MLEPTQVCYVCKKEKQFSDFYSSKRNTNGIEHRCKDCTKAHRIQIEKDNTTRYDRGIIEKPTFLKKCARCKVNKLPAEFHIQKCNKDGLQNYCRECSHAATQHYDRNRRCGITEEEFDWLLQHQGGVCALCLFPPDKRLNIDHDHKCHHPKTRRTCKNCIRGLLCNNCNRLFLATAERHLHLQNDFVREYLRCRPFVNFVYEISYSTVESKIIVSPDSDTGIPATRGTFDSEFVVNSPTQ